MEINQKYWALMQNYDPERQPSQFILLSAAYWLLSRQQAGQPLHSLTPLTPTLLKAFQIRQRLEQSFATVKGHYHGDRQEITSVLRRNLYACIYTCKSPRELKKALRHTLQLKFQDFHQHLQNYLLAVLDQSLDQEELFFSRLFEPFYRLKRRRWLATLYRQPAVILYTLTTIALGWGVASFPLPLSPPTVYGILVAVLTLILALFLLATYQRQKVPRYFLRLQLGFPGYRLEPPPLSLPQTKMRLYRFLILGLGAAMGFLFFPPWGSLIGAGAGWVLGQFLPLYSAVDISLAKTRIYQHLLADLGTYCQDLDQEIEGQLHQCQEEQEKALAVFLACHLQQVLLAFGDHRLIRTAYAQESVVAPLVVPSLTPPPTQINLREPAHTHQLIDVGILNLLKHQPQLSLEELQQSLDFSPQAVEERLASLQAEGYIEALSGATAELCSFRMRVGGDDAKPAID
jgi:hypothetical protein